MDTPLARASRLPACDGRYDPAALAAALRRAGVKPLAASVAALRSSRCALVGAVDDGAGCVMISARDIYTGRGLAPDRWSAAEDYARDGRPTYVSWLLSWACAAR